MGVCGLVVLIYPRTSAHARNIGSEWNPGRFVTINYDSPVSTNVEEARNRVKGGNESNARRSQLLRISHFTFCDVCAVVWKCVFAAVFWLSNVLIVGGQFFVWVWLRLFVCAGHNNKVGDGVFD